MEKQFASLSFSLVIYLLTIIEKRRLKTYITPFTVSAWPFVFIFLLANFVLIFYKFPEITLKVQYFVLVNLLVIWIVGWILSQLNFSNFNFDSNKNLHSIFYKYKNFNYTLILISWLVIISVFYRVNALVAQNGGFIYMGNQEFEDLIGKGLVGHMVQIGKICFLFLVFIYKPSKNKILILITMAFLSLSIAVIQVKYHLLWVIFIIFFYINLVKSPRKQLINFVKLAFFVFLVMSSFWIFLTLAWGTFGFENEAIWEFIISFFFNYLASAPMVLDHWLNFNSVKPDWTLFLVFMNIKNIIMGNPHIYDPVNAVSMGFIKTAPDLQSNVGTAFGVYYLIGGYIYTIFITSITAVVSYLLFLKSYSSRNPIVIFLNLIFLTLGFFNFFAQFFTLISIYEMTIIFALFVFIFNIFIKLIEG